MASGSTRLAQAGIDVMFAIIIVNLTNVGPYLRLISPCLVFGTIKLLIFNSHKWCVNLPRGSRQPAPHMGQVDAGETVSHNI